MADDRIRNPIPHLTRRTADDHDDLARRRLAVAVANVGSTTEGGKAGKRLRLRLFPAL
jgi:hypothetical protein